jgi:hypothetical protein
MASAEDRIQVEISTGREIVVIFEVIAGFSM